MRNPFDSIRKVDEIHSPMLFLHSPEDTVIPISEGRRLYEAARGDKTFVEVRGGHVNSADQDPDRFFGAIRPATSMVEVSRLIDPAMLVEIEAEAVIAGD
jgi:fermentation-respiration switch protein FrsA (DUF1100 family)